ncbi:glutathionylspermidine synthase family protein [Clostridium sp. JS66]|uniref:glutathionylspermidine synthase family protein n=1 Tax=Clostridium sp. JS66 TaxID=3064705 RepID=UPI00298DAE1C|nr:glutathionylspermidine synthase family protein [Clostridium sp. JS66]WPC41403.1 glutathionylspermidine synthase family protein [Clostridium sp. JS66]
MYNSLTDKLLFDYYMIDCRRKETIFSPCPFYLDAKTLNNMKESAETLDFLVKRIIKNINGNFSDFQEYIKDFKFKQDIVNLKIPLSPMFWVRYDAFIRQDGGIFFSEFNYDKPCAQREILVSEYLETHNNLNSGFKDKFIASFKNIVHDFFKDHVHETFNIAVLIDPCHLEECHLSFLYKDIIEDSNFHFIAVGPKNLKVIDGNLLAFGKEKIQVILRQFPTEHMDEVCHIEKILNLYNQGKILIINDPRVIIGQCKSLFAYLWSLIEKQDKRLSEREREVIKNTLPQTRIFKKDYVEDVIKNKNNYVLKPIYGRYSENVFIGILHSEEEWKKSVEYVLENPDDFILQKFCAIHKDAVTTVSENRFIPKEAFGNFGVYLIDGKVEGFCTRWNESYLTCDEDTWITPIGFSDKHIDIFHFTGNNRKEVWNKVSDRAMMEYDFTGSYFRDKEYTSLDSLILDKNKFDELKNAANSICTIFKKAQNLVLENINTFSEVLGINGLENIVKAKHTDSFLFLGRIDWCLNEQGEWKLLEINSETPAGLVESIGISKIIQQELNIPYKNPNENMVSMIKEEFFKILKDYSKNHHINNIGILSGTYYEDWYNTRIIYNIVKDLPYNINMGNIYDVKVNNNNLYLYGKPLDAVFRYYPLDWFIHEDKTDILKAMEQNTLSINPPHTIVTQTKAFLALIFELKQQGFFSKDENLIIEKYISQTSFDVEKLNTTDICIKPLLEREGNGVLLGYEVSKEPEYNFIFQKREHITPIDYDVYSTLHKENKLLYPIIGTYITGDKFCGLYTRLGNLVTTNSCIYSPIFIR